MQADDFGVDDLVAGLEAAIGIHAEPETEAVRRSGGGHGGIVVTPFGSRSVDYTLASGSDLHRKREAEVDPEPSSDDGSEVYISGEKQFGDRPLDTRNEEPLKTIGLDNTCIICFDALPGADAHDELSIWRCSVDPGHHVCSSCALLHVRALLNDRGVIPACPVLGCTHVLASSEVASIIENRPADVGVLDEEAQMLSTLDSLLRKKSDMSRKGAFPCIRDSCEGWITPSRPGVAEAASCGECGEVFCSVCKARPYHYQCVCDFVMPAARCWQEWLSEGGQRYLEQVATYEDDYARVLDEARRHRVVQEKLLREAEDRLLELEQMETWKEKQCKRCPACNRLVEKLDGCDVMKCGQNFHGGDVQNGCGAQFNWSEAPSYKRKMVDDPVCRKVHEATIALVTGKALPRNELLVKWNKGGTDEPQLCHACVSPLQGPKFKCLHCPDLFSVCHLCAGDYTRLVPCEGASKSVRKGRLHRIDHVFQILWNPADEGITMGSSDVADHPLAERMESKIFDEGEDAFVSSRSWRGAMRGYVFTQGSAGIGYYRQPVAASREATLLQQTRALLHQVNEEMRAQGSAGLMSELSALISESDAVGLAAWSRCLFRFGIDLTSAERDALRRVMDPNRSGQISLAEFASCLQGAEEVLAQRNHLLIDVFEGGSIPNASATVPGTGSPIKLGKAQPTLERSVSAASRCRSQLIKSWRRQAAEELFVCLGSTPLLKFRRTQTPQLKFERCGTSWKERLSGIGQVSRQRQHVGEERVVRLVLRSSNGDSPAVSWDLPTEGGTKRRGFFSTLMPPHPFWKTKVLDLDHIVAIAYAVKHPFSTTLEAIEAPSVDRARLFSLWTKGGVGFDFMARSTGDCKAWVLTLGRMLRARGGYARTYTHRGFMAKLVQVRLEVQADSYMMSVATLWMIALERVARARRLPFREYEGKIGKCIGPVLNASKQKN